MISKDSKFKQKLYNIMDDLSGLESSDIVMQKCIDEKLTRSFEQYQNTIRNIYNYVLSRSNLKVVKALARMNKSKEKKNGDQSS